MLIVVVISFVIFNAVDLNEAGFYIKSMLGMSNIPLVTDEMLYYLKSFAIPLIIGLVGATPAVKNAVIKICEKKYASITVKILQPVILLILITVSTAFLVDGSFNPFLYFRF